MSSSNLAPELTSKLTQITEACYSEDKDAMSHCIHLQSNLRVTDGASWLVSISRAGVSGNSTASMCRKVHIRWPAKDIEITLVSYVLQWRSFSMCF